MELKRGWQNMERGGGANDIRKTELINQYLYVSLNFNLNMITDLQNAV